MVKIIHVLLVAGLALSIASCGSSKDTATMTAEERFAYAKAFFDDEDYLEAIDGFTVITLQYPGSAVASDAQYYLGECRFRRGEFLIASVEYSVVLRNYPASARIPDARYKLALSYYMLAPKSVLDQLYTKRALDEFQAFVEYHPADTMAVDAEGRIKELTTRLAKKSYDTARLYSTMEYYKAAVFYYDDVIEKYHDTEFAPLSMLGKAELLIRRNKYQEAQREIDRFLAKYPNSVLRSRGEALKATVAEELKKGGGSGEKRSSSGAALPGTGPRTSGPGR